MSLRIQTIPYQGPGSPLSLRGGWVYVPNPDSPPTWYQAPPVVEGISGHWTGAEKGIWVPQGTREPGALGSQGPTGSGSEDHVCDSKPLTCASLSHWTSFTNHKIKDKISKFKTTVTEHETLCAWSPLSIGASVSDPHVFRPEVSRLGPLPWPWADRGPGPAGMQAWVFLICDLYLQPFLGG